MALNQPGSDQDQQVSKELHDTSTHEVPPASGSGMLDATWMTPTPQTDTCTSSSVDLPLGPDVKPKVRTRPSGHDKDVSTPDVMTVSRDIQARDSF